MHYEKTVFSVIKDEFTTGTITITLDTRGLRQTRGVFQIYLKNLHKACITRWKKKCFSIGLPIIIDESTIYILHFADEQVVFTQDKEDL